MLPSIIRQRMSMRGWQICVQKGWMFTLIMLVGRSVILLSVRYSIQGYIFTLFYLFLPFYTFKLHVHVHCILPHLKFAQTC